jgi:hypothetical protein
MTSIDGLITGASYYKTIGLTDRKPTKAPRLKGDILLPFVVPPSGKTIRGEKDPLSSMSLCLFLIKSTAFYRYCGVPPLGTRIVSSIFNILLIKGILLTC